MRRRSGGNLEGGLKKEAPHRCPIQFQVTSSHECGIQCCRKLPQVSEVTVRGHRLLVHQEVHVLRYNYLLVPEPPV